MLYTQKKFSCPTAAKEMTDIDYGVAVGTHCPNCRRKYGKNPAKHQCGQMELPLSGYVDKSGESR